MRAFLIIFTVIVFFMWKPEHLHSFDTVSGRILMLLGVVYLASLNLLLGFTAALAMVRIMDQDKGELLVWRPSTSLTDLENLLRPKDSASFPTLRTTTVPVNDVYEQYNIF